jgi:hypothetical protein
MDHGGSSNLKVLTGMTGMTTLLGLGAPLQPGLSISYDATLLTTPSVDNSS